jgi:hypothetical protein
MLRQICLSLGLGAFLTVGTSIQPATAQKVQTSSDGVLDTLESRNYENNAEVFFPEISQEEPPYFPKGTVGTLSDENNFEFEAFGEEFIVGAGEFLADDSSYSDPDPFVYPRQSGFADVSEDEEVWLLLELEEWNS